jgi:heat shock protein HslJ
MKILLLMICVVLSLSILAAGCLMPTQLPSPATTPAVTAVQTYVENQQGVAIIRTVTVTATPTVAVTATPTVVTPVPVTDPALTGRWNLKGGIIGGSTPVVPNTQLTLTFNDDGTLTGFSGCNNYNGRYVLSGQTTEFGKGISIGPIASTTMYCAPTMNLETTYLTILGNANTYSITNTSMLIRSTGLDQLSFNRA